MTASQWERNLPRRALGVLGLMVLIAAASQLFVATRPPQADSTALLPLLQRKHVEFAGAQPSPVGKFFQDLFLGWLLPLFVIGGLWALAASRLGPGAGAMRYSINQSFITTNSTNFAANVAAGADISVGRGVGAFDDGVERDGRPADLVLAPDRGRLGDRLQ